MPASRFKDFVTDPDAVAASLRRPMPEKPFRATRLGTLFHAWVEHALRARRRIVDELDAALDELDSDGDGVDGRRPGDGCRRRSRRRAWAERRPIEVEREIHLPFDGRIVICKIDAIYDRGARRERRRASRSSTGRPARPRRMPTISSASTPARALPARLRAVGGHRPEQIDAAFYFVADDRVIAPEHIDDEAELLARWRAAF